LRSGSKRDGFDFGSACDRVGARNLAESTNVIPAKAGIQFLPSTVLAVENWILAFAGLTLCLLAFNPCPPKLLGGQ